MKKILVLAAMIAATICIGPSWSNASVMIANWTFETSVPTTGGPHAAEAGFFAASSFASSNTGGTFSNPAGNGSAESFSSNGWNTGEYFQFTTSTTGFEDITIQWDQTGSNTGPRDFVLQYDIGSGFQNALSYQLTNDGWSSATGNPVSVRSFDFSAINAMENLANVTFRLTMTGTTAITGGTVAAAGSGRVDNFVISATAVPEPTALLMVGSVIGAGLLRRRRA